MSAPEFSPEELTLLGRVAALLVALARKSPARFLAKAERIAGQLEAAIAAPR